MPTLAEKRKLVQTLIAAVLTAQFPTARIYNRFVFDANLASWFGKLRNDAGIAYSWQVSFAGFSRESKVTPGAVQPRLMFDIVGMRGYDFGTDAANSEDLLADDAANLCEAVAKENLRYLGDTQQIVNRHFYYLPTFDRVDFGEAGKCHRAQMRFEVELRLISTN